MKLQFDSNESFPLDAVAAVTELFDGQPQGAPESAVIQIGDMGVLFAGQDRTELGASNRMLLPEDKLAANARRAAAPASSGSCKGGSSVSPPAQMQP